MYLSLLLIDVGNNPDRPRPGRLWLRNVYHVHQRLCMAFPTDQQRACDPGFLRPYAPDGFAPSRFLFRIDHAVLDDTQRAVIVVQSHQRPDWEYAFQNAGMFLAAPPACREYHPAFADGQRLRFRIRANLTRKGKVSREGHSLRTPREGVDRMGRPKDQGRRVALTWDRGQDPDEVIRAWFDRKAERAGFLPERVQVGNLGWVDGRRSGARAAIADSDEGTTGHRMRFRSTLLEGVLTVTDAEAFDRTVEQGLGSGKAFGFGLLSVAPG